MKITLRCFYPFLRLMLLSLSAFSMELTIPLSFADPHVESVCKDHDNDSVWVARNFGIANMILIEFAESFVVIDTMESYESAQNALFALAKASGMEKKRKPISKVIFTHFHQDHTYGANAIFDYNKTHRFPPPQVWSHYLSPILLMQAMGRTPIITMQRGFRQFGVAEDRHMHSCGVGPYLGISHGETVSPIFPDFVFGEVGETHAKKVLNPEPLELFHTPGETSDQIAIFLPNRCGGVLFPGDNIYKGAFPSIMPVRGAPYRNPLDWVESLKLLRQLKAEVLVPSHNAPIIGADEIDSAIDRRMRALKTVHDQTLLFMNRGMVPVDIVAQVKLPPDLKDHPDLAQTYGTVASGVLSVFSGYLGWFSGDPADLVTLTTPQESKFLLDFGGGAKKTLRKVKSMIQWRPDHLAWKLKLFRALRVGGSNELTVEEMKEARDLEADCMRQLATTQTSWQLKNYLFTSAKELEGLRLLPTKSELANHVESASIDTLFAKIEVSLKAEPTYFVSESVLFYFSDQERWIHLRVEKGVAWVDHYGNPNDVLSIAQDSTVVVELTVKTWKNLVKMGWAPKVTKSFNVIKSWWRSEFVLKQGNLLDFARILNYFESPSVQEDPPKEVPQSHL